MVCPRASGYHYLFRLVGRPQKKDGRNGLCRAAREDQEFCSKAQRSHDRALEKTLRTNAYMKVINKFLVILIFLSARSFSSEPYVIGHLMGQLGNQMFIVAATVSLTLDHGATPLFPEFKEPGDPIFKFPINYEKIFFSLETRRPEKPVEFYYY